MTDRAKFDARLADAFDRYFVDAPTTVNAAAVAAAVAAPTRRARIWSPWQTAELARPAMRLAMVALVLLLTLAIGGTVLIGSGILKLPPSRPGSWTPTGSMTDRRHFNTATRLLDDRVLVAGGACCLGAPPSAEIYDPATRTWNTTGPMIELRYNATATLLPDGRVLVAGGSKGGPVALASAELYDPSTGTWSATAPLADARSSHTATLLPDGRVLVAGGFALVDGSSRPGDSLASAVIYDPATETWSATGPLAQGRGGHTATLLPDGRVLVAGGYAVAADRSKPDSVLGSAEIYDPATGTWSATGPLAEGRSDHTATLLADGRVLVAGGYVVCCGSLRPDRAVGSAEVYDPATGTWSATGPLAEGRGRHTATLLSDGRVLVAGGCADSLLALASAELYDPMRRSWTAAASMDEGRCGFAAVLLKDATVLVAGGYIGEFGSPSPTELYDPAGVEVPGSGATPASTSIGSTATAMPTVSPSAVKASAP